MGLGCVAKLNQPLSINASGSHVFGGSSNYVGGSLDSVAWRGGFVLKLGKLDSPAATNEQLQSQLNEVKQENASIKEESVPYAMRTLSSRRSTPPSKSRTKH